MSGPTIVWFRQDLRLHDHPALAAALRQDARIVPVYIWSPEEEDRPMGGASRWWLHHALADLDQQLAAHGLRLIIRCGPAEAILRELIGETGATRVYWSRRYEPAVIQRDARLKTALRDSGIEAASFNASLLHEPWTRLKADGTPYRVYTPFSKSCFQAGFEDPVATDVAEARGPDTWPTSMPLAELDLLPRIPWDAGFYDAWEPTRAGAMQRLLDFTRQAVRAYDIARDFPGEDGTSRLSPYLHFGQIGPREIIVGLGALPDKGGIHVFAKEVVWREFAYHLLYHFPQTVTEPMNVKFRNFPWEPQPEFLSAWQKGQTGYPIIDAGMRQLWATGWMHNRVRMIVGSLLVKHLLISWREGEAWFWDTLVDADLASNILGWQWIGGCGADAAPYFRVFNPLMQASKFAADGAYIHRWVPELARLPAEHLAAPWEAPLSVLRAAGVSLGKTYPRPIIEHEAGRQRALAAFAQLGD